MVTGLVIECDAPGCAATAPAWGASMSAGAPGWIQVHSAELPPESMRGPKVWRYRVTRLDYCPDHHPLGM